MNISTYSKRFLWENGIQTAQSPPWFTYWLRFDYEAKKEKASTYVCNRYVSVLSSNSVEIYFCSKLAHKVEGIQGYFALSTCLK